MNTQQRKVLERIVNDKIAEKRTQISNHTREEREKLEKSIDKKYRTQAEKWLQQIKNLQKEIEVAEDKIKKLGFGKDYSDKSVYVRPTQEQTAQIDEKHRVNIKKIDEAKNKLITTIWGIEGDFTTVLKLLEDELKGI